MRSERTSCYMKEFTITKNFSREVCRTLKRVAHTGCGVLIHGGCSELNGTQP